MERKNLSTGIRLSMGQRHPGLFYPVTLKKDEFVVHQSQNQVFQSLWSVLGRNYFKNGQPSFYFLIISLRNVSVLSEFFLVRNKKLLYIGKFSIPLLTKYKIFYYYYTYHQYLETNYI